jgi:Cu+-exporting ATPase
MAALTGFRQRVPVIEIPIALGILALMGQSVFEVFSRRGDGYFDSLAGLLFFLLCGRLFQQKTYARLVFDRDYRAFFPLAVTRSSERGEERVAVAQLAVGDRLILRHGELVPADSRLLYGEARIDYAFVTGESQPESCALGGVLFAGGRQTAGRIEVEILKPVSQGYLTSLWNQEAFQKVHSVDPVDRITEAYSRRFSLLLLVIASGAAAEVTPGRRARRLVERLDARHAHHASELDAGAGETFVLDTQYAALRGVALDDEWAHLTAFNRRHPLVEVS